MASVGVWISKSKKMRDYEDIHKIHGKSSLQDGSPSGTGKTEYKKCES